MRRTLYTAAHTKSRFKHPELFANFTSSSTVSRSELSKMKEAELIAASEHELRAMPTSAAPRAAASLVPSPANIRRLVMEVLSLLDVRNLGPSLSPRP